MEFYSYRIHLPLLRAISCCLLAGSATLWPTSATANELAINLDSGSRPTMYEGAMDEAAGIYPEILRLAFARMGTKADIRPRPFRRLIAELNSGVAGAGAYIRTPEREAANDFSAPYFIEHVAVFHRPGQTPFSSLADLRGARVGIISGWSYGSAFDQARQAGSFKPEEVGSDAQNFEKLARHRIDYVIATELAGRIWLLRHPESGISQGKHYLISAEISLAFNKRKGLKPLLTEFDRAVQALQANGDIERIVTREIARYER